MLVQMPFADTSLLTQFAAAAFSWKRACGPIEVLTGGRVSISGCLELVPIEVRTFHGQPGLLHMWLSNSCIRSFAQVCRSHLVLSAGKNLNSSCPDKTAPKHRQNRLLGHGKRL